MVELEAESVISCRRVFNPTDLDCCTAVETVELPCGALGIEAVRLPCREVVAETIYFTCDVVTVETIDLTCDVVVVESIDLTCDVVVVEMKGLTCEVVVPVVAGWSVVENTDKIRNKYLNDINGFSSAIAAQMDTDSIANVMSL